MKRLVIMLMIFLTVSAVQAQKEEPSPTPSPVPEVAATLESEEGDAPETFPEVLASLPQSRLEDGGFVVGDPAAPITIIEFADWACPHCQDYREIIEPVLITYLLSGQAKYEFRPFPTAGGELTLFAAQIAECADQLQEGGFWASYDVLYAAALKGAYSVEGIVQSISTELDLDSDELLDCATDAVQVITDLQLGIDLGVQGTPAVMVRLGDDDPVFIQIGGETYDLGGVPADILVTVIENAQQETEQPIEASPTPNK